MERLGNSPKVMRSVSGGARIQIRAASSQSLCFTITLYGPTKKLVWKMETALLQPQAGGKQLTSYQAASPHRRLILSPTSAWYDNKEKSGTL